MEHRPRPAWLSWVLPIYVLGVLNLVAVFACYSIISHFPKETSEHSIAVLLGEACLGCSLFLTAYAIFCIYWAAHRKTSLLPATLGTLLAAFPLAFYFVRDVLPRFIVENSAGM